MASCGGHGPSGLRGLNRAVTLPNFQIAGLANPAGGSESGARSSRKGRDMIATHELFESMKGAEFVVVDGVLFEAGYVRVPDEFTVADDVVLEARHGDTEIDMTREELEDAALLGEGVFRSKSGSLVRFLSSAVVH